jgi:hypothetical protein
MTCMYVIVVTYESIHTNRVQIEFKIRFTIVQVGVLMLITIYTNVKIYTHIDTINSNNVAGKKL